MDQKDVNDLVREGLQMRAFRHPNVMELYGLCWSDDPANVRHTSPLVILPYMELGDLKNYLRRCRLGRRASVHFHLPDQQRKIDLLQAVGEILCDVYSYTDFFSLGGFGCRPGQILPSDC